MAIDTCTRRDFMAAALAAGGLPNVPAPADEAQPARRQALIAITLDLEMSRNFPTWEQTQWDYEKGNLNSETKNYAVEACRRVKAHGGVLHCFSVARVLEQADVEWLKSIARNGHPIGNHTYDHVNVKATRAEQIQFRFQRAPWLIAGKTPSEVIYENIRLASAALRSRAGIEPAGFRTPGGFNDGLHDRPDVQRMLMDLGFKWVSSLYPAHPLNATGKRPDARIFDGIVKAQAAAQPCRYPSGLIEVPMSPISDVTAFRAARWKLGEFLTAVRLGVEWAIAHGGIYDFLGHPSCLYVVDPSFRTIEMICSLVEQAGSRAAIADLTRLSGRASPASKG